MKLNEVLRRLKSMSAFAKPHIPWPSGVLMKTDEGKAVLSELYRVCGVVPINVRWATGEEMGWLKDRAKEWWLDIALIYDPYRSLPADGSANPDPAGEHGDLIREEVRNFVVRMTQLRSHDIVADHMLFDHARFLVKNVPDRNLSSGMEAESQSIIASALEHNRHMTERLNDFCRLARVYQPEAAVSWYGDGPISNQDMRWSPWITPATRRDMHAPRCYTPQRPEIIVKQLAVLPEHVWEESTTEIVPYLSLGSAYTVPGHQWDWDMLPPAANLATIARVMRHNDNVKAVALYPQPGEPKTPRYWEAFFSYAEGWV